MSSIEIIKIVKCLKIDWVLEEKELPKKS